MVAAVVEVVDGAGDQFLAGSGLAADEDSGFSGGDRFDFFKNLPQRVAVADNLLEVLSAADLI